MDRLVGSLDVQVVFYIILALIPNLFLILWAVARLSRDVRILKAKHDMMENDINLLDQSISSLTSEFQAIRKMENEANAAGAKPAGAKPADRTE
jgi:Tfp pilus assembly protein PilN